MVYKDFESMLDSMARHVFDTGDRVISADEPDRRSYGWTSVRDYKDPRRTWYWEIRLVDLSHAMGKLRKSRPDMADVVAASFRDPTVRPGMMARILEQFYCRECRGYVDLDDKRDHARTTCVVRQVMDT